MRYNGAIDKLNSEVLDIPIYEYEYGTDKLCITMAFCGAPGAAVAIEELTVEAAQN